MPAKVLRFSPGSRPIITLTNSQASIGLVQRELLHAKLSYSEIGRQAGIANSTVSNIATGTTRWPRIETIIRILGALGWVIAAHRGEPPE